MVSCTTATNDYDKNNDNRSTMLDVTYNANRQVMEIIAVDRSVLHVSKG